MTILFFLLVNIINAQVKESDYYTFYKGGNKHLKPLKYIFFYPKENYIKTQKAKGEIYFKIESERFYFNNKKHRSDTCSSDFLGSIKLENVSKLRENEVTFYKKEIKKTADYKETGFSPPFPVTSIHSYFKVYILEKSEDNKVIKYEVDWEYSDL